jgi:stalled ribosome alternative rescue factor ArfA
MAAANDAKDTNEARKKIVGEYLHDGTITTSFERKGKGKVSYSHRQHTRTETRYESLLIRTWLLMHWLAALRLYAGWLRVFARLR